MDGGSWKGLRARARMTQTHLAIAAGVSERSVQRLESGRRVGFETLRAVGAVLGADATPAQPAAPQGRAPGPGPGWTDELVVRAVGMWMSGMGGEDIALVLGSGLTKNSVICKMFRHGAAFRGARPLDDTESPYPPVRPGFPGPDPVPA